MLDPSINTEHNGDVRRCRVRAGVLEPEGIVEIKLRKDKVVKLMERLDEKYAALKKDSKDTEKTPEERASATDMLDQRTEVLAPTYQQLALLYADLHE